MPIGTSDGEHFEDAFHQGVEMLKQKMSQPSQLSLDTPTEFVEDRRYSDPMHTHKYGSDTKSIVNYLQQDLSKAEKDPLSQEAGIGHISNINPQRVMLPGYFPDVLSSIEKNPDEWVDRKHEVPYIAGASKDSWLTHIDKSIPKSITVSGKKFDPAIPLAIHEQTEKQVMEFLISKRNMPEDKAYQIAHHEYAQVAEDNWYRKNGIDVNEVNKFWKKINTKTEKDKGDFPPNLYTKPYPHNQVKGEKHAPSNVFQEWPIGKE